MTPAMPAGRVEFVVVQWHASCMVNVFMTYSIYSTTVPLVTC